MPYRPSESTLMKTTDIGLAADQRLREMMCNVARSEGINYFDLCNKFLSPKACECMRLAYIQGVVDTLKACGKWPKDLT